MNRTRTAMVFTAALAACHGSDESAPPDMTPPADLTPVRDLSTGLGVQPPEPPMETLGGPVLATPTVYTVVWAGDEALGATIDTFHKNILNTPYWTSVTAEYGVGPGVAAGVIVVPGPRATALDSFSLETVADHLFKDKQFPLNDNTVLDFIIPADIQSIDGVSLDTECQSVGGYHSEFTQTLGVPYIVDLQCPDSSGTAPLDRLTFVDTHEMIETSTDPHIYSSPAWQNPWLGGLGELGDMCNDISYELTVPDLSNPGTMVSYSVSRAYSAKIAAAGMADPCEPAVPGPYYNIGVLPSNIMITSDAHGDGSTVVDLVAFTHGHPEMMSWYAFSYFPGITIVPNQGEMTPGETTKVTIHTSGGPQMYPTWFVVMVSNPANGVPTQQWIAALTIN